VFKIAGKVTDDENVDDKATIDLSAKRLRLLHDEVLKGDLGHEFADTVNFFETVEEQLVPLVLQATSNIISTTDGIDFHGVHAEGNNNFRLTDYTRSTPRRHGCGEHRDYGTATIIFQDGSGGLEFQDPLTLEWRAVPGDETVVVWGWCAHILSGGKINAVKHRVKNILSARRNTAVFFVAPDLITRLMPLGTGGYGFAEEIMAGRVDVEMFKEMMGKRWRYREGNEKEGESSGMSQDEAVIEFLYGSK
jgi:isopenicillin N synthase-like dioxygenase